MGIVIAILLFLILLAIAPELVFALVRIAFGLAILAFFGLLLLVLAASGA